MIKIDRQQFAAMMTKLAKANRAELDKNDIGIYYEALNNRQVTINQIAFGVDYSIAYFDGMPRPAKLIEFCMMAPRPKIEVMIPQYTSEQHEEASQKFQAIIDKFSNWGLISKS